MKLQSSGYPRIAAAITAVISGFSFLVTKDALDHLDTYQLLGFRFLFAALFITVLAVSGVLKAKICFANIRMLIIVALFQPVLYFICETIGVGSTSASESSIICSLVPVVITLFAVIILKERLSRFQGISIIISALGVIMIILSGNRFENSKATLGYLFLFVAVLSAGIYNVLSRRISNAYTPAEITIVMMWTGAVIFNAIGICNALLYKNLHGYFTVLFNSNTLLDVLYLGVLSSVITFFFQNYALSKIEASKVAVFMNLTPITAILAGVFIRGERLYFMQWVGAAAVLIGLWGVNCSKLSAMQEQKKGQSRVGA
ncbi:MAG: DMT family transporter [Clostridiaceae bacterium]